MKTYERRYHAQWMRIHGPSALATLGRWMYERRARLQEAPRELLIAAAVDVAERLPGVAARECTHRHRRHFAWLLAWHLRLLGVLEETAVNVEARA